MSAAAHLRPVPPEPVPPEPVSVRPAPESERLARVTLSCAVEPGDATTSGLVRQLGAERALEQALGVTEGEAGEMLAQRLAEVDPAASSTRPPGAASASSSPAIRSGLTASTSSTRPSPTTASAARRRACG